MVRNLLARTFRSIGSAPARSELQNALQQRVCRKNEILLQEREAADVLFVVPDGAVELFATHNGLAVTVAVLDGPLLTPLEAVVLDGVSLYSVRKFCSGPVYVFEMGVVRDVLKRDREFACALTEMLVEQQANAVRALLATRLRTADQRLAAWVLERHAKSSGETPLTIHVPKKTLASCLGMAPENLSRALLSLGQHGLRCKGKLLYLDDPQALAEFAKPNAILDTAPFAS